MSTEIKTCLILSSHGEAVINAETGEIISIDGDLQNEYNIKRFDVAEWNEYKAKINHKWDITDGLDILEIGYWHGEAELYEPAVQDHRAYVYEGEDIGL